MHFTRLKWQKFHVLNWIKFNSGQNNSINLAKISAIFAVVIWWNKSTWAINLFRYLWVRVAEPYCSGYVYSFHNRKMYFYFIKLTAVPRCPLGSIGSSLWTFNCLEANRLQNIVLWLCECSLKFFRLWSLNDFKAKSS